MEQWTTRRIVVLTLTVGTVLYLVYHVPQAVAYVLLRIWGILVVLILSSALALVLAPPVELLCRLPVPLPVRAKRITATILVLAALIWVGWWVVALTAVQMFEQVQLLATIGTQWLQDVPAQVQGWLDAHAEELPEGAMEKATGAVAAWTEGLLRYQFGFAKGALLRGWYVVELLVIPVLAVYFLADGHALRAGALRLVPTQHRPFAGGLLDDVGKLLDSYVRAQALLCLVKGLLVGIVLYLAGVEMYLTLAIIAAVFRMAPVVGPIVALVPCVGVPMLQYGMPTGLVVLFFYWLWMVVDGKLLTPIMLAESAAVHPVVVILSLLIGYEFLGPIGLLIAVPVAGVVRVVYLRYHETFGDADANGDGADPAAS